MITIHQTTNIPNDNGINRRLSRRNHFIPLTSSQAIPAVNTPSPSANTTMMFNESKPAAQTNKDTQDFEKRIKELEDKLANIQSSIESSATTTIQSSRFRRR
jgi:hypothetical protein